MNSLYQQLMQNSQPQTNNLQQMANVIKNSRNPKAMLEQMMQSNPRIQQALNYINQNGGDAKSAFYALARQKGVDPESVLKMFR